MLGNRKMNSELDIVDISNKSKIILEALANIITQENGCGYEHLSIILIEQVEQDNEEKLCDREIYWQHQLREFRENGGNAHCVKNETESYLK